MLRCRWGSKEWNGAWSDGSPEWASLSERQKAKLGLVLKDDGEFWITFDDFCEHFSTLNTCSVVNTTLLNLEKTWVVTSFHYAWASVTAGGCKNEPTYMNNPQFVLHHQSGGEVIIGLAQMDSRAQTHLGKENYSVGLQILRVEENRRFRLAKALPTVARTSYINTREVVLKTFLPRGELKACKLEIFAFSRCAKFLLGVGCWLNDGLKCWVVGLNPRGAGRYVIIPTTFQPQQETSFLLRIFKGNLHQVRLLQTKTAKKKGCLGGKVAKGVVRITVVSAVSRLERARHVFSWAVSMQSSRKCCSDLLCPIEILRAAGSTEERHGHSSHDDRPLLHREMRKDTVDRIGAQRQSEPGVGPKLRVLPKEPGDGQGKWEARYSLHARSQQCCNPVGSRCWGWGVDGLLVQLVVTVLDKNVLLDSFCGQVRLDVSDYTQTDKIDKAWEITKQLGGKNKAQGDTEEGLHAGTIQLRIQASFAPDL